LNQSQTPEYSGSGWFGWCSAGEGRGEEQKEKQSRPFWIREKNKQTNKPTNKKKNRILQKTKASKNTFRHGQFVSWRDTFQLLCGKKVPTRKQNSRTTD